MTGTVQSCPAVQNFKLAESSNKNQGQKAKCCGRMVVRSSHKIKTFYIFQFSIFSIYLSYRVSDNADRQTDKGPSFKDRTLFESPSTESENAVVVVEWSGVWSQHFSNPPPLNPAVVRSFLCQIM